MSMIIMILLLGLLIFVHELGHFLAAKAFGMRVEKFGFGLPVGPTLFEKKIGETTFVIHALLLGGYVSFPDDDKDCELPLESTERFENKPIWQKLIVVSAGVFANIVCAFFLVLLSALIWNHLPSGEYNVTIDDIVAPKTASVWSSGLQKGDRLVSVNGTKINSTYTLLNVIQLSKADDGLVSQDIIDKNYTLLKRANPALSKDEIIPNDLAVRLPNIAKEHPIVFDSKMAKGVKKYKDNQFKMPSKALELRKFIHSQNTDKYFITNGNYTLYDIAVAISDNEHPLVFVVDRGGKYLKLKPIYPNSTGAIGVKLSSHEVLRNTNSIFDAIKGSTKYLYENTYMMLVGLEQVFTGKVPLQDLHGIVAITKVGGDIIDTNGLFYGLLLTAIISMDLAIVNFLPIPALDGGQVLFLIIEAIMGRKVNKNVLEIIATISFFLLILLMVVVIFNDVWALITQKL